jgi:hypothetical protein
MHYAGLENIFDAQLWTMHGFASSLASPLQNDRRTGTDERSIFLSEAGDKKHPADIFKPKKVYFNRPVIIISQLEASFIRQAVIRWNHRKTPVGPEFVMLGLV